MCLRDDALHKNQIDKDISLDDPIADSFYKDIWLKAADENTHIYEEVFRAYPTNLVIFFVDFCIKLIINLML